MAERLLPGLVGRPLSLVRCPNGCTRPCFFQKHAKAGIPARVGRVSVTSGETPYTQVSDLASVVALVQIAVIEFHVWAARSDRIERPDLLVFDLDPGPTVPWRELAATARRMGDMLGELGFVPFLRTTGGKGLHVVVPLLRRSTWSDVKHFAHAVALRFVREAPERFTAQLAKHKRAGRILIDYLRNQRDATAIASYSVRARPGAPLAMPLAWEELDAATLPVWTVRSAPSRLAEPDPWNTFEASRRALSPSAIRRVESA
jgi:bifunctional non-homologous end joining protein LigD